MSALSVGQSVEVPGYPGRWQVWSKSDAAPGAYFVVKDGQYMTIKAIRRKNEAQLKIEIL